MPASVASEEELFLLWKQMDADNSDRVSMLELATFFRKKEKEYGAFIDQQEFRATGAQTPTKQLGFFA